MRDESGNIFFIILISIALFAALTNYALTSSSKNGGSDLSAEKINLMADEMIQVAGNARASFDRLRLTRNLPPEKIEYAKNNTLTYNTACTSNSCRLHHPDGGGFVNGPAPYNARYFPTNTTSDDYLFRLIKVQDVGTSLPDIVLYIYGIEPDVCEAINRKVGITGVPGPIDLHPGNDSFVLSGAVLPTPGVLPTVSATVGEEAAGTTIKGKQMFCYCTWSPCNPASSGNDAIFVSVVMER